MRESLNITSPSPDRQHTARFTVGGEIRFGPLYYALSIDHYSFGERIFGEAHLWSPAAGLLAVQEWLTLDYSEGPITELVLIDLGLRREAAVARATKGFTVPEAFAGLVLTYRNDYAGGEVIERFDLDIMQVQGWRALV
jgi:hypothetical protein